MQSKTSKIFQIFAHGAFLLVLAALILLPSRSSSFDVEAAGDYQLYGDSLSSGWANWSWGSSINFDNSNPAFNSSRSIAFTPYSAWGGLYLHNDQAINTTPYSNFHLTALTNNNQKLAVLVYDTSNQLINKPLEIARFGKDSGQGSWKIYDIPLSDLTIQNREIKGVAIQEVSGQGQPTIYIDEVVFQSQNITTPTPTQAPAQTPTPTQTPIQTPPQNPTVPVNSSFQIYTDNLRSGWTNWSWNSGVDFNSQNYIQSGSHSIAFTPYSAWAGLYLHTDSNVDTTPYKELRFAARATNWGQKLQVIIYDNNNQPIKSLSLDNYGGNPVPGNWKNYSLPLTDLWALNRQIKGVVIQEAQGYPQPTFYIDNIELAGGTSTTQPQPTTTPLPTPAITTPTPTNTPQPTFTPAPTLPNVGVGNWSVSGGKIYNNGQQFTLKGVNWFGFETANYAPHGLWSRGYKEMISQMKNLGFNSVRVPVCPASIQGVNPSGIDYSKNPELQGLNSLQVMDKIMNEFNNQGMAILLDHHRPDCSAISQLWYVGSYSESQWINDLKTLAARYKNLPYFMGIDLKNEPHGSATWGTGSSSTDWNSAAERAGNAILATNSNILIFVEGVQDNPKCSSNIPHWYGGNLEPQACNPISLPGNKLVLSPHVYGPDVYPQPYFSDPSYPNNLPAIWETHFGYLVNKGFAIVPGEWGGKYGNGGDPRDYTWQNALVNYFKSKGICSSYYWSWNPNSGDTGGVLQDDWATPWTNKVQMLQNYFNTCK